jgi:hypothetical protein
VRLDGGVFLLQWATGGLALAWVTTRRREVGLGYGWLLRAVFGSVAAGGAVLLAAEGLSRPAQVIAFVSTALVAATALAVLGASFAGRKRREFDPGLDVIAPAIGVVGLAAAAQFSGGPVLLAAARLLVGAAFLGCVTDAMLLGHWYLVQPGLPRDAVNQLVRLIAVVWPVEVAVMLWPTGMVQVLNGTVDDGWNGLIGWTWLTCAVTTIALVGVTWAALRERAYSAVMAATGLLYLAILTAFGTDLLARAVLRP